MLAPRRLLPSTGALSCLEAVARLGSATRAAEELSLTQSAVSRQLKTLEAQLGVTLVQKEGRGLRITEAGADYALRVRQILDDLAEAGRSLQTRGSRTALNLAILPAFGMHWLAPRLSDFAARNPEITVNISTRLAPFDLRHHGFDAAIHFGRPDWQGADHLPLMPETVIPVCAPGYMTGPAADPRDLLSYPLLHLDTRARGWQRWFDAQGVSAAPHHAMMFDQFSTMAQAAIHGSGIALLPRFVAAPYLQSGQLVQASTATSQSVGRYFLVWPKHRAAPPALEAFRDWIAHRAAETA